MNPKNKIFGQRLRAIRKELGLSQEEFVAILSKANPISQRSLSAIETGERKLCLDLADDICEVFKINLEWIRTGKGEKFTSPQGTA